MTNRITAATFSACITNKEGLPKDDLPIIALVGRSNVGKSSLINSLTGRKELARTSSLPGKTLTINFYCINDAFYLVDLPGYGFAKASKVTRAKIQAMMDEFFLNCNNLKGVAQIVDIRHKPSPLDVQMHNWLREQRINNIVVLTKTDKVSNQQGIKTRNAILREIRGSYAMNYSSKTLVGRDEFLDAIEKIIAGFEFKVNESPRPSKQTRNDDVDDAQPQEKVSRPKMTGETRSASHKERTASDKPQRNPKNGSGENSGRSGRREHRNNGFRQQTKNTKPANTSSDSSK